MPRPSATTRAAPRDLTQGPIPRTLAAFALPVLGANVLQSLNGSVNAIWIGNLLGEAALTATSNANLVLFLLLGSVFGMAMAATILVGQAVGARDIARAKCVVGTGTTFFLALSTLVAIAGGVLTPFILHALGTPAAAFDFGVQYLRVIFIAVPVMNAFAFTMAVLRGAGDARTPFLFMAVSVGLDIALNPLLIRGVGPVPPMGIAGSAMSTLVAQVASLGLLLVLLHRRHHPLLPGRHELRHYRPRPALLRAIVVKGVPMGLQMIVISAAALALMGLVNGFGVETAAAYGVAAQLWTYVQMPALAIGAAVSSMAAQNIGANRWDRVGRIAGTGVAFNLALTGLLAALLYVADRLVLGLFLPAGSPAIAIAVHINDVACWSFVLFGITIVLFGVVRAAGAVMPPLLVLVVSLLLVRVPFAWLMRERWGADAIWWSFPLAAAMSAALAFAYYRLGRWRQAGLVREEPATGTAADTGVSAPSMDSEPLYEAAEPAPARATP
ncbi:MATE family efflux transporter [Ramlibacter sp. CrO1]|uniref:MATE family efflux transporter n=2 Tax=Ramlibacter algicola TaxID=2795217 RepID=A0A934PZE0_9BURK|nr:MATE family efflux transporter [Ramlibacter algicola]MBK0392203.1 MATE family efflux transporter [Ramlibacter algicola]